LRKRRFFRSARRAPDTPIRRWSTSWSKLYNRDEVAHRFRAIGSATLRGSTTADIRARISRT
jgi:hypothetical protein